MSKRWPARSPPRADHCAAVPTVVVGVQSFELSIPGAGSLKAKRSVVKSLKDRLRRRFNV
ncbi:MAG: DUF503 family protein, partial [Phycisphaerales bacterium]|nr:DUF503 family protein [Phycisphaerales bacterium]